MSGKKKEVALDPTDALLKFREKRKWQIAFRRYVLERNASSYYAPFFGLDIELIRKWFENQFQEDATWDSFGKNWQFDHIVPVNAFDFSNPAELKLCWHFTNIRVMHYKSQSEKEYGTSLTTAKSYFEALAKTSSLSICIAMVSKIEQLIREEQINTDKTSLFIKEHEAYLLQIENYSSFEFELLNSGNSIETIEKEIAFQKKYQ